MFESLWDEAVSNVTPARCTSPTLPSDLLYVRTMRSWNSQSEGQFGTPQARDTCNGDVRQKLTPWILTRTQPSFLASRLDHWSRTPLLSHNPNFPSMLSLVVGSGFFVNPEKDPELTMHQPKAGLLLQNSLDRTPTITAFPIEQIGLTIQKLLDNG